LSHTAPDPYNCWSKFLTLGTFQRLLTEMDRVIVSVSQNAVIQAETEILGCDRCIPHAKTPFWHILSKFRLYQGDSVIYILPVLATCPNCREPIDEITRVEPRVLEPAGTKRPAIRSQA